MIEAGRFSYAMYELLVEQNRLESKAMIKRMGEKWVCHPKNQVKRLKKPLGQLTKGSRVLNRL